MDPYPPHPQCPAKTLLSPCCCPRQSTGTAVRVNKKATYEAQSDQEEVGCSAATEDPHNKMEHK